MKNFLIRTATAFVLLPVAFVAIQYFSRFWFFIIVQIVMLAALIEFYNLPRKKGISPHTGLGIVMALIIALSFYYPPLFLELALFICILLTSVYYVLSINQVEKLMKFPSGAALTFLGAIYLSFTLNHLNWLRDERGPIYIYFMLIVIFIGDTGAMLIGKALGKHKMTPIASPNKTWEGSLGGIITGCLAGIAFQQLFLSQDATIWKAALFAVLLQIIAQISDPMESLFKRASGVKDSSHLLPGHGGFLDRVDSMILCTPFFYYALMYIGMK